MSDLGKMLETQEQLQRLGFGINIAAMSTEQRIQFIKEMKMAMDAELQEMLDEIGWKPWASSRHIHVDEALHEMVDAWHFFMNILLALGFEAELFPGQLAEDFTQHYYLKKEVNAERQAAGYDGVSSKCPNCHTELTELPKANQGGGYCTCGAILTSTHLAVIRQFQIDQAKKGSR